VLRAWVSVTAHVLMTINTNALVKGYKLCANSNVSVQWSLQLVPDLDRMCGARACKVNESARTRSVTQASERTWSCSHQ